MGDARVFMGVHDAKPGVQQTLSAKAASKHDAMYESTLLGYAPGDKPTMAAFLSRHLAQAAGETDAVPGPAQQKNVLQAMHATSLKSRQVRRDLETGTTQQQQQQQPPAAERRLWKGTDGFWAAAGAAAATSPTGSPRLRVTALPLLLRGGTAGSSSVAAAAAAGSPCRGVRKGRSPFDVFLATGLAPELGRRPHERPQSYLVPLKTVETAKLLEEDIVLGTGRTRSLLAMKQLDDFEAKHKELLSAGAPKVEQNIKVVSTFKGGRVKQMLALRQSVLPSLFRGAGPRKLQQTYAAVTGTLLDCLTLPSFHMLTTQLLLPEKALPPDTAQWMFKAIDKNLNGSVGFVEFIAVVASLVLDGRMQDSMKRLFTVLQDPVTGTVGRATLYPSPLFDRVSRHKEQKWDQLKAREAPAQLDRRKELGVWRSVAARVAETAADLGPTDQLGRDDLTVLLYMDEEAMKLLSTCVL